jgi:hypothetical protein
MPLDSKEDPISLEISELMRNILNFYMATPESVVDELLPAAPRLSAGNQASKHQAHVHKKRAPKSPIPIILVSFFRF